MKKTNTAFCKTLKYTFYHFFQSVVKSSLHTKHLPPCHLFHKYAAAEPSVGNIGSCCLFEFISKEETCLGCQMCLALQICFLIMHCRLCVNDHSDTTEDNNENCCKIFNTCTVHSSLLELTKV